MEKVCLGEIPSSHVPACYNFLIEQEKPYRIFGFVRVITKKLPEMAKTMLDLSKFRQKKHLFLVKMRTKLFRRGIPV
jgi:hypothetical protein